MSLSDVIELEKTKRKQTKQQKGHSKANPKPHNEPKKGAAPRPKQAKPQRKQQSEAPKPIAEENKRRLFVKNLHEEADNAAIFEHFKQFGTLTRCGLNWDKLGKSKGTAIVQFEEHDEAEKALKESNGVELKGQAIEVAWA
eukprot:CAMPEP_0204899018 /NCGR_PEP_ID=MMETSP1397-20131031/1616_1 /ASSEMBLY_ACC=CAM_ASM_000891 /TAXON_ID=49980 /ORGANISM="Climacostomum Climacostomum virens, Strain Stock W-24" /LENGTH=140 /DNA_ID=CAMNT_0052066927 /DNA_START=405 /DNA_END=830 /DNA_ORIENTATION=-